MGSQANSLPCNLSCLEDVLLQIKSNQKGLKSNGGGALEDKASPDAWATITAGCVAQATGLTQMDANSIWTVFPTLDGPGVCVVQRKTCLV